MPNTGRRPSRYFCKIFGEVLRKFNAFACICYDPIGYQGNSDWLSQKCLLQSKEADLIERIAKRSVNSVTDHELGKHCTGIAEVCNPIKFVELLVV